jgi:hypothetical protein
VNINKVNKWGMKRKVHVECREQSKNGTDYLQQARANGGGGHYIKINNNSCYVMKIIKIIGPQLATSQQLQLHATHTKNC